MSNFKSGSGNLDFGANDEDDETDDTTGEPSETQTDQETRESTATEQPAAVSSDRPSPDTDSSDEQPASERESAAEEPAPDRSTTEYPYFVRRSNVGDERETRLEIHVRDKVADQEAAFRSELAEHLDASEISKTDAREFALLTAFRHPERVAELMKDEGFGTFD